MTDVNRVIAEASQQATSSVLAVPQLSRHCQGVSVWTSNGSAGAGCALGAWRLMGAVWVGAVA